MSNVTHTKPVEIDVSDSDAKDESLVRSRAEQSGLVAPPAADEPLSARIEAILVATDRQLSEARLADLLGLSGKNVQKAIKDAIEELNSDYDKSGRSFRIERLAGGYQILTRPQFSELLERLFGERQQSRLSQAALETLAIIAYRQPILRAEVEAIRGVACGEVLRSLLERRLVKITGRAEEIGRPMLYGTTSEFLKVFGLASLDDLPNVQGLSEPPRKSAKPQAKVADEKADAASDESEASETD
jgi:segregation and condensation protein B